jgi:hypothetical protein
MVNANTPAVVGAKFKPTVAKTKYIKNSCKRNGVLRKISTYAPAVIEKAFVLEIRPSAPNIPIIVPASIDMNEINRVSKAPYASKEKLRNGTSKWKT